MSAVADEVMAALADPTRWRVLSLLAERGEGTATTLAGELPVSRVEGARRGREVRYRVRPERLEEAARWMAGLASQWDQRLDALKRLAEEG
jgi:hypothetical protein